MIFELRGVDFVNKGGELMLHAIISRVKQELPSPLFVMEKTNFAPRSKLVQYGIYTKTNFKRFKISLEGIFHFIPSFLRRRFHFINEGEIDVIFDASGFAFGDVWGPGKASVRLGNNIEKWKNQGKKIIILPQAFGPFSNPKLISVMKKIINNADLIFARDKISLKYLSQLEPDEKFNLTTDFTNLIKGTVPTYFDTATCEVAIIVNSKMIETTTNHDGEAYFTLLPKMISMIEDIGFKPFFLIHESRVDKKIAEIINKKLFKELPVVEEENPLHVKGIISQCKAVITSRFHGLVSSLCQAIPCLATGWSHKYDMILNDYEYGEGMVDVHSDDELLLVKLKSILLEPSRSLIIEKLKFQSIKQTERSEEMWRKVFKKITEPIQNTNE